MAFWYWFTCPSCGYITKASGARANGLAASVDTMVCRDCDELVDVLIDARPRWMEIIDPHWMERLDTCPQCHGRNLEEWSPAFPCPGRRRAALWPARLSRAPSPATRTRTLKPSTRCILIIGKSLPAKDTPLEVRPRASGRALRSGLGP